MKWKTTETEEQREEGANQKEMRLIQCLWESDEQLDSEDQIEAND